MTATETTSPANASDKGKRGRKPGQEIKKRPDLSADSLGGMQYVAADQRFKHRRRREDLTPQEESLVKVAMENYQSWVDAGSPANWNDMPIIAWPVTPSDADNAEFKLRKAVGVIGRKLALGQKEPQYVTNENGDFVLDENGKKIATGMVLIPFCVIARPPKKAVSASAE